MILIHGRGDSAAGILTLADAIDVPDVAWVAPQAAGNTWYPYPFLAPMSRNEPGLSSALRVIGTLVTSLQSEGLGADRIVLMGFSQGACLSLEFAARNARRYAAVVGLSGGLIGPPGTSTRLRRVRSTAHLCFSAAAISIRTFPSSGCTSHRKCFAGWERL